MITKQSKMPKYFPYLVTGCMLIWFGLLMDRVFLFQTIRTISNIAASVELLVHAIITISTLSIYKHARQKLRYLLFCFVLANIGLFISEICWTIIIDRHAHYVSYALEIHVLLECVLLLIWTVPLIIFLLQLLDKYIVQAKGVGNVVITFAVINIIIILLFLSSVHYADKIISLQMLSQIFSFVVLVVLFDLVILCIISAESRGFVLFLLGYIGLISGYLFPIYDVLSHTYHLPAYGEIIWLLGLLLNLFGILMIQHDGNYNVKHWVRKDSGIKSKFVLWCFSMAIVSFLLFFILAYAFSIISKVEFLGLPLFVMIYSAIVIVFSVYLGEYFEEPFKRIENNIRILMKRGDKEHLDQKFSIQEFIFLQKFIIDAFEHLEKDQNTKQLGELTAQVAHDIQSPLSSLQTIVQSTTGIPEGDRITLRAAAMQIGDITNHMLHKYKNQADAGETLRQQMLVSASLLQALSAKRYEYKDLPIEFKHKFEAHANFAFINVEPIEFKRMISNVINNAVDALTEDIEGRQKCVALSLDTNSEWIIVIVEDNGSGMPDEVLEKIRQNVAVTAGKKDGHGLGLTQVRETLRRNLGELEIYSGKYGTKVMLFFPRIVSPHWIADEVVVVAGDLIIILDDDASIHGAWDARLLPVIEKHPDLRIKHLYDGVETVEFITQLSDVEKSQICLLSDYELLGQNINGVQVIKQSGVKRTILVTSHYADPAVRKAASDINVKILPKDLVFAVDVRVNTRNKPHSKIVDMVWVDDEKGWLEYLVNKYYKDLQVDCYYDPITFLEDIIQYPLDTKIIMDNYYYTDTGSYDLEGTMLAKKLHDLGYTRLFLLSGEKFIVPEYLTLVLKTDQESLATLDKL